MDDRTQIAALALAGLSAGLWANNNEIGASPDDLANEAVQCADALLARLAETAPPEAPADPAPEAGWGHDWSEAMERAIADAIEIAAVRGADDEDMAYRIARAVLSVDRAERLVVLPPGWVAVPREPTEAMWRAGLGAAPAGMWRRMLAAAPPCPGVKEGEQWRR